MTTNIYSKSKLQVITTVPGALSHTINCHCKTINCDKETTLILKKVNFYKFKSYVGTTLMVKDWADWYSTYNGTQTFFQTLADFINCSENRTCIYRNETDISVELDKLILKAKNINNEMRHWLAAH